MNGISQNAETLWDQNDPKPCLQGDLNPDQYILAKKVMKKIKFRLKLKWATQPYYLKWWYLIIAIDVKQQTKYIKGNKYIIYL